MDKRHVKRIHIMQQLYTMLFQKDVDFKALDETVVAIATLAAEIDEKINEFASRHGTDKIAKIDLAILRLAVWELLYKSDNPPKVIINEAIELAKEYGSENSSSFVNAILGQIYKKYKEQSHDT